MGKLKDLPNISQSLRIHYKPYKDMTLVWVAITLLPHKNKRLGKLSILMRNLVNVILRDTHNVFH